MVKIKTVDDLIAEVNRCHAGRYEAGMNEATAEATGSLRATIRFDSARWDFFSGLYGYVKTLVLYSQKDGAENGRIRISDVQGIEHIRGNEQGNAYVIIAGNDERHLIMLDNPEMKQQRKVKKEA